MSVISIRLVRKNTTSANNDDLVIIRRSDNNIRVNYTDHMQSSTSKQNILLTNTNLGCYIKNLSLMFMADAEPFANIQFAFPGFPVFMATQESLQNTDTQDMLMEVAEIVSDSWFADSPSRGDPFESHW